MTVTLSGKDLAFAQRLSAVVCAVGWKQPVNTHLGWRAWLYAHGVEIRAAVDGLGDPDDAGAVSDYIEYQRRQWWRLMGMAARPWGLGEEDGA